MENKFYNSQKNAEKYVEKVSVSCYNKIVILLFSQRVTI